MNKDAENSETMSVKVAAQKLGIHWGTLYNMVKNGAVPVVRIGIKGRGIRISKEVVEKMLSAR